MDGRPWLPVVAAVFALAVLVYNLARQVGRLHRRLDEYASQRANLAIRLADVEDVVYAPPDPDLPADEAWPRP